MAVILASFAYVDQPVGPATFDNIMQTAPSSARGRVVLGVLSSGTTPPVTLQYDNVVFTAQ